MTPAELERALGSGEPLALIDVREHGEYNAAHIPWASAVPRRLIEDRIPRLVPSRNVPVIVCDDDGRRAALAAQTLRAMGYAKADVLEGGLNLWASEGRPTEWGMNVPSKDFGEKIEVRHHVPTISARDLHERIERGDDLLILDTRTPEEFQRACIPGGRSVPGAELALRIADLVSERPDATVVVNCAGRTRSIIGARVLQRMGLTNFTSLRNGTSGWTLAGLTLEHQSDRTELPEPSAEGHARAAAFAQSVAREDGVRSITVDELRALMARAESEAVYLIDVRGETEFEAGHIPGFWWFPGGQAVQRCDELAAVHAGHVIFCCDGVARSHVTASWFRQLGFPNVYAVDGGTTAWAAQGRTLETGPAELEPWGLAAAAARVPMVSPSELAEQLSVDPSMTILFVDTSREFAAGHVPGARWLSRSWLELEIGGLGSDRVHPIVATDSQGASALRAAATLLDLGYARVSALADGMAAWRAAGLAVERGLSGIMEPPVDVVPAGTERTYADMVQYLRWEEDLGRKYEG